jgi:hypothetical protein
MMDSYVNEKGKLIHRELLGYENYGGKDVAVFRYWTDAALKLKKEKQLRQAKFDKQGRILPGFERSIIDD